MCNGALIGCIQNANCKLSIFKVIAKDADPVSSANGKITYSLQSDSVAPLPFKVNTEPVTGTGYVGVIVVSGWVLIDIYFIANRRIFIY